MTRRSRPILWSIVWLGVAGVCGTVLTLAGSYLYLNPQIPAAQSYLDLRPEAPMRVFTGDGALMAEFGVRRFVPVPLDGVPEDFVNALLDTEDKRFYDHSGIDYISFANDVLQVLMNPSVRTGASTITMQLARNVSFSLEQTFIRKFKEMLLAIKIEQELTKEQILELYINVMFFGKRAYGAQAAALTYYDRPLSELNLAQLAMLAGIVKRPDSGNPISGPDWALNRRNLVLARMLAQGSIDRPAFETARAAPITARLHHREPDLSAPYAAEWVRSELVARYGPDVYNSGYEVHTTIDARLQANANRALRNGLTGYDRRHGYRGPEGRVEDAADLDALVALAQAPDPTDGGAAPAPIPDAEALRDSGPGGEGAVWARALGDLPVVADLWPAAVVRVDERAFEAVTASGARLTVDWDGITWARAYIDVDRRGVRPRAAADVVAPGDIVRVQALDEGGWRLAQVPDIQGAVVALRPESGAVAALVGGYDFWSKQYDHALRAARQPGSGFKPFVYSAALAEGVTPSSIFLDAPLVFEDRHFEKAYRPRNDSGRYNGPTRLREALYRSINLVTMRVLLEVGVDRVLEHAGRFGFDTEGFPRDTQLAIGGGTMAVTPLDMARGYAVIANGGFAVQPHIVKRVVTRDGALVFEPSYPKVRPPEEAAGDGPPPALDGGLTEGAAAPSESLEPPTLAVAPADPAAPRVIDERNVFILHSMLRDVIQRGTGRRARSLERADIAGKTGTTNEAADTWFNGYNDELVASVWVGFSDYRPVGRREYGSTTPLSVWMEFMGAALEGLPEHDRAPPEGVVSVKIDPATGLAAAPDRADAIFEYFFEEAAPDPVARGRAGPVRDVTPEDIF
ncbi:MAG: PBP1A family penicillin-binding protein [Gammaproteobacteria bacterium]|nr:PBP1A family penicillin-binding protein [Gammaproteobacteria bacterium]